MDLHTATTRYEEQRQFWAREIAGMLGRASFRARRLLLRMLAQAPAPMDADAMGQAIMTHNPNPDTRRTLANALLLECTKLGLVRRRRQQHAYWYTLSELGALVLEYLPPEAGTPPAPPPEHRSDGAGEVAASPVTPPTPRWGPAAFDTTKYSLGKLCPQGHEYQESGKTLRFKNGGCTTCEVRSSNARAKRRQLAKAL